MHVIGPPSVPIGANQRKKPPGKIGLGQMLKRVGRWKIRHKRTPEKRLIIYFIVAALLARSAGEP